MAIAAVAVCSQIEMTKFSQTRHDTASPKTIKRTHKHVSTDVPLFLFLALLLLLKLNIRNFSKLRNDDGVQFSMSARRLFHLFMAVKRGNFFNLLCLEAPSFRSLPF